MEQQMQAWVQDEYGGPEVVHLRSVPRPGPQKGEVQLRVQAVALNSGDIHVLQGDPYLVRPVFGIRRPKNPVRGMDVAGMVTAVGPDVDPGLLGAALVGEISGGGLAQYAVAPADRLVPRPPDLAPATAAAVPVAGGTAVQALALGGVDVLAGAPSETGSSTEQAPRVLVLGASGGVGTYAVQLAAEAGCVVSATCSEANRAVVARLGATTTYDRRETPVTGLPPEAFDVVLEIAGARSLGSLRALLAPGGTAVLVGGEGGRVLGPVGRIIRAQLLSIGRTRRFAPLMATPRVEVTSALLDRVAAGRIAPLVAQEYRFAESDAALAHVASGRTVGKVIVRVE